MMGRPKIIYYIVLLMLQLRYSHVSAKQNYLIPKRWILQDMPYISTIFATSEYLPDSLCREDTQKFLHHLLNGSAWAVQMFDSSTKYPEGILYGHTRHLGNFDECYNLHVNIAEENANIREINGKYCLINIEYNNKHAMRQKLSVPKHQSDTLDTNTSFWEVVEQLEDSLHVRRNRLQLALCVPATCNEENVEIALGIPLKKFAGNKSIELQVQSISCQTSKDAPKYTLGAGIYCAVLLIILSLVITSTWYDNMSNKNGNYTSMIHNIVLHFSARRNYAKIVHVCDTGFDCIYFIRLIAIIYAAYLHYLLTYLYTPIINAADMEKIFYMFLSMTTNATFGINIFFALSGVLLAYQLLKDLDQYKKLHFIKNVTTRYLRLTPLYATLICFYIWIFPLLGSGPYWYLIVEECTYCTKHWWLNLLYINNYAAPSELCILHGWYLAADFQLFVCSQFVIYAFWCMPRKIGYTFLGILTLISCTASFVATYTYGASSVLRVTPYVTKLTDLPEFVAYYIKGHICATGYLVGIIAGAILHDHKGSTWRLSKFWSHILLVYSIVLFILALYWSNKFFILDKKNLLEEAIFAFFQRLISSLCICSIIVLLSVDSHLKSYLVFIPRWVQSLSNLSYGVYMTNMMLVMYDIGQTRTARTYSILKSIWNNIPLLMVYFLLSLFLGICIEMPFRNLAKWLFPKNNEIALERNDTIVVKESAGSKCPPSLTRQAWTRRRTSTRTHCNGCVQHDTTVAQPFYDFLLNGIKRTQRCNMFFSELKIR